MLEVKVLEAVKTQLGGPKQITLRAEDAAEKKAELCSLVST